jgi:hypothetical protein
MFPNLISFGVSYIQQYFFELLKPIQKVIATLGKFSDDLRLRIVFFSDCIAPEAPVEKSDSFVQDFS